MVLNPSKDHDFVLRKFSHYNIAFFSNLLISSLIRECLRCVETTTPRSKEIVTDSTLFSEFRTCHSCIPGW
jgi:hypothetical protein